MQLKIFVGFLGLGTLLAQNSILDLGRYHYPATFVAGGSVVDVIFRSQTKIEHAKAVGRWPESLSGVRATIREPGWIQGLPARVGQISGVHYLSDGYRVRLQLPHFDAENTTNAPVSEFSELTIFLGNAVLDSRPVRLRSDAVHLMNESDGNVLVRPANFPSYAIGLILRHANGTLVSAEKPAAPGETVTAFLYGLQGDRSLDLGSPFHEAASVRILNVRFAVDYGEQVPPRPRSPREYNALPSVPVPPVPGEVGLFRVDFTVPQPPAGQSVRPCGGYIDPVYSNATLQVYGAHSFDGGGFCVATGEAPKE